MTDTTDRELLELAAKAAAYVGERRYWTPSYPGARPVECTAWSCSVTASFNCDGMAAEVGPVWTNYRTVSGRLDQVWFTAKQWEAMPVVASLAKEQS